ncbi:hypothetical protein HCW_08968 (plasmid) [Helicobacter cetorum MIT 00-7128]|uniref:Uncharacterized protein n=1 Tax=Helicobacter cetorum (strain ATCC BAA-429 / MIT 00-7128) TaxID=182217 RepID=I0EQ10_HELC0|nr:hypothetical protein HCW_08968 [Helicobacter cetorum MIT 00-7128]
MLGLGISVGGYPEREITHYEITISNHSYNGSRNTIILKFFGSSVS